MHRVLKSILSGEYVEDHCPTGGFKRTRDLAKAKKFNCQPSLIKFISRWKRARRFSNTTCGSYKVVFVYKEETIVWTELTNNLPTP